VSESTIDDALTLMRVAGALACCGGRPRNDCPYDLIYFPAPYHAWTFGWDQANVVLRTEVVGA